MTEAHTECEPGPRVPPKRRPKPARGAAFGILNPYGNVWTFESFPTEAAAREYLEAFWRNPGFGPQDTSKFQIVPVRVTVSAT
jgi:hypothetical protein